MLQACMIEGFFYIINHGIDSKFLTEVFAEQEVFHTSLVGEDEGVS